MKTWYIAISCQSWGRGESVDEAKKQLRKAGGDLITYLVYRFDGCEEAPWIDEMGNSVTKGENVVRKCVVAVKKRKPVECPA